MKKWEKVNNNAKINKNHLFNIALFKPAQLNKIENAYNINTFCSNKNSIILFQKKTDKKITLIKNKNKNNINIKVYNYSHSKSNEKKSKTLNNTLYRKKRIFNIKSIQSNNKKICNNIKILSTKSKNIYKKIEKGIHSPLNKSLNKIEKKKILIEKRNKTPITKNRTNLRNKGNKEKDNKLSPINNIYTTYNNYKTFYNTNSNKKNKIKAYSKINNSTNSKSKEKIDTIKKNKSFNNQSLINTISKKKSKNIHYRHHNITNKLLEEGFNTFNNTTVYKKEINSYSYYTSNNSITRKNNKINKEKKPRVDTLEYLSKIMNSIKSNHLKTSINEKKKEFENNNNNSYINIFRKKNKEKNKSKDEKNEIKRYMKVKKKLFKLNNIKKKNKEKEEELKKYLQLYKLQENIFNSKSGNNTFYNNNSSKISKTKNISNKNRIPEVNNMMNNNLINKTNNINSDILSSIDSTIVDKNNFYQGIMDIQNIYSNNIINHNIIINNYPNSDKEKNKQYNKIEENIQNKKNKKINSRNNNELNNQSNNKSEDINDNHNKIISKTKNELKEEKIDVITYTYSSPIKDENIEEKELNGENIIINNNINNNEITNEFQINELNDYSFKLNTSNDSKEIKDNNEINSLKTSKFFNSQILSEDNRQSGEIKDDNNNNIINPFIQLPPSIQLLSENNSIEKEKKYTFTKEKLENYKEILISLIDYLKLITQRNALNDIISYGDTKYKYKVGFEMIVALIKFAPFNIIRAIQQTQYYHFAFRQLFIPYITKSFNKLKKFCYYDKLLKKCEIKVKHIFRRIAIKKIKQYKKENNTNNKINTNEINVLKNENKKIDTLSNKDLSESKENDLIEWEYSLLDEKKEDNKNNNVIKNEDSLSLPDLIIDE